MMGDGLTDAVRALDKAGADIIGANCGLGAEHYAEIAREMVSATKKPVMVEPNAGMPELIGGKTVFPMTPDEIARHAKDILATGVRIIGGCCGTTPNHIRAIRNVVDKAR
jgi:5-methyltetrahydrofolate--homocysteine methyltransferase